MRYVHQVGLVLLFGILGETAAFAGSNCTADTHTMHQVTVDKDATCVLSKLYEPDAFCLVDDAGNEISGVNIAVAAGVPFNYGLVLGDGVDFNMEYGLTCVENDGAYARSPKAIFAIGAGSAANPEISVVNLNGATGTWSSTHNGENYSVQF